MSVPLNSNRCATSATICKVYARARVLKQCPRDEHAQAHTAFFSSLLKRAFGAGSVAAALDVGFTQASKHRRIETRSIIMDQDFQCIGIKHLPLLESVHWNHYQFVALSMVSFFLTSNKGSVSFVAILILLSIVKKQTRNGCGYKLQCITIL